MQARPSLLSRTAPLALLLVVACGSSDDAVPGIDASVATGGTSAGGTSANGGTSATGSGGANGGTTTGGVSATGGTSANQPDASPPADDASTPDSGAPDADSGSSPGRFRHPGILVSGAQFDFVKEKIAAKAEPWTSALAVARSSTYGAMTYAAKPVAVVECGSFSNPDIGCTAETHDATAAYTHALLWYFTGDAAHARKAIEIMNAWSALLTDHTNSNAPLQSAWSGSVFPRAAEIIRWTYSGWPEAEAGRFAKMLRDVYLPKVINGAPSTNGNWELSMAEAVVAIGVFLDDEATFDKGVAMWRARVPAYFYLTTDGTTPRPPPRHPISGAKLVTYWYEQTTYVDGLCQETCRDLGHVQYGLAAMLNAAETARIQGVDLIAAESRRITAALEFHARFINGASVPSTLCGGTLEGVYGAPTWEVALDAYGTRLGTSLPQTQQLIGKIRPTRVDHHMNWETLTHAGVP